MSAISNFLKQLKDFFIKESFIGNTDIFLNTLRRAHPVLSASQLKEKLKHDRIFKLRDQDILTPSDRPVKIWKGF